MKTKNLFCTLFLFVSSMTFAQSPVIEIPLIISNDVGDMLELRFGLDPLATDSIDTLFGEKELPPFPPSTAFEARFFGDEISLPELGQGTYRDYRTGGADFDSTKTHELKYQVGSGTTITISWNLPSNVSGLIQDFLGGVVIKKLMIGIDSVIVSNPGVLNKLKMIITYTGIPLEPTLVSPLNDAENLSTDSTLVWKASNGATSYRLQIATDSTFLNTILDQIGITDTLFQFARLQHNTTYFWHVNASNDNGTSDWSDVWKFTTKKPTSVQQSDTGIPSEFNLSQNFPNPFNPITTIEFSLTTKTTAKLTIFDIDGHHVQTLVNEIFLPGKYRVQLNAHNFASGIYFYRLQTEKFSRTKRFILLK